MHGVVVVGSINMDLAVKTEIIPAPGQTVMGRDLLESPGGKGANQAAAAGRLAKKNAPCRLIGRIGDDNFAQRLLAALQAAKVDTTHVIPTKKTPSGVALIVVDRHGENSIVVAGGANQRLSIPDLLAHRSAIEQSKVLAVQLEIPFETVACAIALAKRAGTLTILDPAPAPPEGLPESLFHVDILTPNQNEAHLLTGIAVRTVEDAKRAGTQLLARGTHTAIIKMGPLGAVLVTRDPANPAHILTQHIPGFRVPVVDTTAAGDAFNGALATAIADNMPLLEAVRFANAAGALACTKPGAQTSLPTRAEVETLIQGKPKTAPVPAPIAPPHKPHAH
jgi:ribokinase